MCSRARGASLVALLAVALAACGGEEHTALPAVATSVEPACASNAAATEIAVRGTMPVHADFSMTSGRSGSLATGYRVWLGAAADGVELGGVRWVDASTVVASVPAGVAPGTYAISVESPFAVRSTLDAAFRVVQGACDPQGARLAISAEATPSAVAAGESVTVTATVTNGGDAPVLGVTASISGPAGFSQSSVSPPAADIAPGESHAFVWTYTATAGGGRGSFVITAAGIDAHDNQVVTATPFTTNEAAVAYAVGGTVAGLPSNSSVVLQLNGRDDLTVAQGAGTGALTFAWPRVASGTAYTITIARQPVGQTCRLVGPSGTVTTQDVTSVQVNCDPNSMSLSAAVNGTGTVRCNNAVCAPTYLYGTALNVSATPATGWSFTGWSGDCSGTTSPCVLNMTADRTLTATFTLNTYPVTITQTAGGTVSGPSTVSHGAGATFTATPSNGYEVAAWTGCSAPPRATSCTIASVTGPLTVSATFQLVTYPVTITQTTGGTISGPATITHGGSATYTATPATGYSLTSWACPGTATGNTCSVANVTGPITVSATFSLNTYAVTIIQTAGGAVVGPSTVTHGTTATFTATPDSANGYSLAGWAACPGVANGNTCAVTNVTGPLTVSATFSLNTYAVTITQTAGGNVTGPSSVQHGATATFTATPAVGHSLGTWSCPGTATGNTCTVTNVTAPLAVSATFLVDSYPVTITPTTGGTVSGPTTVNFGESATFTATPSAGYALGSWSGCAATAGSPTCTVSNVTGPLTVSMTFVPLPYRVSGTITGLVPGDPQVTLRLTRLTPTTATRDVSNRTAFSFPVDLHVGDTYEITVAEQPTGFACAVAPPYVGQLVMPAADVTDVVVGCLPAL